MLTVLESLKLSTKYLENKGVESPRLNAEILLAEILGLKRLELYLQFERPLTETEKNKYREFLARRGKREPLQYIIGYAEFMGEKFKVTEDVLIPRPETELLVEQIANDNTLFNGKILDIGTGSGNIAVMLAKLLPDAEIIATDISEKALEVAKENAENILENHSVNFILADLFDGKILPEFENTDILVSNPPYISAREFDFLEPEVKLFEPSNALTDNGDGLSYYVKLAELAGKILSDEGKLYFELGAGQSDAVRDLLTEANFTEIEIIKDYAGIDRIIKAKKSSG